MNENQIHNEPELLQLLGELQLILTNAINSLDTKQLTPETRYLSMCAVTVNQATGGYYVLRTRNQKAASKFMIRPILEATISAGAVMRKKGFLFRKAYTELLEEEKDFPKSTATTNQLAKILAELEAFFKNYDKAYPVQRKKVDLRYTAETAQMLPLYEVVYRCYCKYTHGSIPAALGQLDTMTDDLDSQFVNWLLYTIIEQLQHYTPAAIPDLSPYRSRLNALLTKS